MFSKALGVHHVLPDKDRLTYLDELLGETGSKIRTGDRFRIFRLLAETRIPKFSAILLRLLNSAAFVAGFITVLSVKTGLAALPSVTLAWNADTDPTVVGYTVFYGTSSASLSQTNKVGKVTTATVSNLTTGNTYYFAVTAYNAAGVNSGYSNIVSFTPSSTPSATPTPTPKTTPTPTPKTTPTPTPKSTPTPTPKPTPTPTPKSTPTPTPALPVAKSDSGFVATENAPLSISASALLANDTGPNSYTLSISGVGNPTNGTVSYNASTQTVTFVPMTGYTGAASFTYTITDGHGTASASVTLTVNKPITSLFSASSVPTNVAHTTTPLVLGVKLQTSVAGAIQGIRFYKSVQNVGAHVATLWSATGTLLATAPFTNETSSGWQQVNFSSPVTLTPKTTYIAAYSTTAYYSFSSNYFATALASGPLTAPASSASGGNGVYANGGAGSFPSNTYQSCNYWVDVAFAAAVKQPPLVKNDSGFVVAKNTPLSIPASALLANDSDPNGYTLSIAGVSNPTNGTVSFNANTQAVTFVPTTNYTGTASFTYTISNSAGVTASGGVTLTVSATTMTSSLFSASVTPSTVANENTPLVLGVKFQTSVAGAVKSIRFYKSVQNVGQHVATLWSATRTLLATATFTGETASGWQQVNLATPVTLTPKTTYIVAYSTSGYYSVNTNYFGTALNSGPLTALASTASGGNGVYVYGGSSSFPSSTYQSSNYWVDIVFNQFP